MTENQSFDENLHRQYAPEGTFDEDVIYVPKKDYVLSDKVYGLLDPVSKVWLPGIGALYFALAVTWGLPKADEVVATCAALATFLGLFLIYAERTYDNSKTKYDGALFLSEGETVDGRRMKDARFGMRPDLDAQTISGKKQLIMQVVNQ